jgi:hypothetical protein
MPLTPEQTDYRDYPEYISVDVPIDQVKRPTLPFGATVKEGATHIRHTLFLGGDYDDGKRHFWERKHAVLEPEEPVVTARGYRDLLGDHRVPVAPSETRWRTPIVLWVASEKYAAVVGPTEDDSQARVTLIKAPTAPIQTYRTLPTGNELADGLETRLLPDSFAHLREDLGMYAGRTDLQSIAMSAMRGTPLEPIVTLPIRPQARTRFASVPDWRIIDSVRTPIVR